MKEIIVRLNVKALVVVLVAATLICGSVLSLSRKPDVVSAQSANAASVQDKPQPSPSPLRYEFISDDNGGVWRCDKISGEAKLIPRSTGILDLRPRFHFIPMGTNLFACNEWDGKCTKVP